VGDFGGLSDGKMIGVDQINDAFDELEKGDIAYRFVIDMASLKTSE
jgi:uncharacterized zinc-type alcohol dehydrogenase-like protein